MEINEPKKSKWWMPIILVVVLALIVGGLVWWSKSKNAVKGENIKIGVITDLTGPAAYWGESTRVGAEIAQKELKSEGYNVELIFEDYQLDAEKALTSAQKLANIDNVDAVYTEFNPAAISVGSFLKDKNKLYVYDAAVTSPLQESDNFYKTYLDYQKGCKGVAKKFQESGIEKIGVLKVNLEFGELCQAGVKEVYGSNMVSESYNLGDTDFKTQVLKLKNENVGAIINTGFEGDTLSTLKAIQELKFNVPYGTVDDTITDNVKKKYPNELKSTWTFGFTQVDPDFSSKIKSETNKTLSTEYGAAIAYTHLKQMVKSLDKCEKDLACTRSELSRSPRDNTIGFNKFVERIADLTMAIKQY